MRTVVSHCRLWHFRRVSKGTNRRLIGNPYAKYQFKSTFERKWWVLTHLIKRLRQDIVGYRESRNLYGKSDLRLKDSWLRCKISIFIYFESQFQSQSVCLGQTTVSHQITSLNVCTKNPAPEPTGVLSISRCDNEGSGSSLVDEVKCKVDYVRQYLDVSFSHTWS